MILLLRTQHERRFDLLLRFGYPRRLARHARIAIVVVESSESQDDSSDKFVLQHLTSLERDLVRRMRVIREIGRTAHRFIEREELIGG